VNFQPGGAMRDDEAIATTDTDRAMGFIGQAPLPALTASIRS
jgi:hypothetical protein